MNSTIFKASSLTGRARRPSIRKLRFLLRMSGRTRLLPSPVEGLGEDWWRERDSNPRCLFQDIHDFQSCSFDHSDISPILIIQASSSYLLDAEGHDSCPYHHRIFYAVHQHEELRVMPMLHRAERVAYLLHRLRQLQ